MTNLKFLQKFFLLLFVGFSLCAVQACDDDDDDDNGGGGEASSSISGTWGMIEYYCIEKYDGNEYVDEASGNTPEEVYQQTHDYVYLTLNADGGGYYGYKIGEPGESFSKWKYENGKLHILYGGEYDDEDVWTVTFRNADTMVLEDKESEDGEYYEERMVYTRMK